MPCSGSYESFVGGYAKRKGKGTRKPSAYALFVQKFSKEHPGPNLMKRAAAAWKKH